VELTTANYRIKQRRAVRQFISTVSITFGPTT
jgi:hypothetical protein